jgi:hypothetical protein
MTEEKSLILCTMLMHTLESLLIEYCFGLAMTEEWKVVILNNEHDARMIIPFSVSHTFRAQRRATVRESCKTW